VVSIVFALEWQKSDAIVEVESRRSKNSSDMMCDVRLCQLFTMMDGGRLSTEAKVIKAFHILLLNKIRLINRSLHL